MLKKIIRKLAYRFYLAGHAEYQRKFYQDRRTKLEKQAEFDYNSTAIDISARIINHRNDANFITIGKNSLVRGELMILRHGGEISIGKDCFIGEHTRIWSSKKIVIGNRVLISHNVNIHDNISHSKISHERHEEFLYIREKGLLSETVNINEGEIIIGDDVWIGFNCTIMKNVKIGKGAIIGSNTTIKSDVEPFAIVVGNPQRVIGFTK